jgi:dTDP-4-amino-4,6-dideoxygalactose transaminase
MALASLGYLEGRVVHRNAVADRYRTALGEIPGIGFQTVPAKSRSSYKDFTVLVDAAGFGCNREAVVAALHAEGIQTRPYYSPPVHRQQAYTGVKSPALPVTDRLAARVISLPIWSHLPLEAADRIGEAFLRIQANAGAVEDAVRAGQSA